MASNILPFPRQPANDDDFDTLPPSPNTAILLAFVYQRLGGSFSIGSNGQRYMGHPEPILFRIQGQGLPQMPKAKPHEQFHSEAEWQGAIKLLESVFSRMDQGDTELLYSMMAAVAIDDRKLTPSIEEPKRRAA